jgi:hypothetical protein
MPYSGIKAEVQAFVREHIDSVEQLEVLLLLHRTAPRRWTAETVSRELRIDATSASRRLADLASRGLLDGEPPESATEFWLSAGGPSDALLRDLAATYAARRVTLIEFIFAAPVRDVRVFADAFWIRKRED